jgi:hypothetical protein
MGERAGETSRVFPTLTSVVSYMCITLIFILTRRP